MSKNCKNIKLILYHHVQIIIMKKLKIKLMKILHMDPMSHQVKNNI